MWFIQQPVQQTESQGILNLHYTITLRRTITLLAFLLQSFLALHIQFFIKTNSKK